MNYIQRLEKENRELRDSLKAINAQVLWMYSHLTSEKFQGFEPNGDRRDWIATRDVLNHIEPVHILSMGLDNEDELKEERRRQEEQKQLEKKPGRRQSFTLAYA